MKLAARFVEEEVEVGEDSAESTGADSAPRRFTPPLIERQIKNVIAEANLVRSSASSSVAESVGRIASVTINTLRPEALKRAIVTEAPARNPLSYHPTINLQEWEGRVTDVSDETFTASLVDLSANEDEESEQVELPVSDLSDEDMKLLQRGAVFRWVIGYRKTGATKERFSRVVFRRMPAWSRAEIERVKAAAVEDANAIVWD